MLHTAYSNKFHAQMKLINSTDIQVAIFQRTLLPPFWWCSHFTWTPTVLLHILKTWKISTWN